TRTAAIAGLAFHFEHGFLERWLTDAVDEPTAARAAHAIRHDHRALKLERWLQGAGLATYFIADQRIDSLSDLARLPERGGDLAVLWEHIREGVPQQRFQADPVAVGVLEEVRTARSLDDRVRPLIACLRLGLRRLPLRGRLLDSLNDLGRTLNEPGGRE